MLLAGPPIERALSNAANVKVHRRPALLVRAMRAVVQRVKTASVEVPNIPEPNISQCMVR